MNAVERGVSTDTHPAESDILQNTEIAASWHRSTRCGLDPATAMNRRPTEEVNLDSRLARAARPVVERLRDQVRGSRFTVMLVDSKARMLMTGNGCHSLDETLSAIGAHPGAVWTEETTGTNALATPYETRRPIFVHGREHYVEPLKDFSCYGAPILDPVTGRVEGVLDIMSDSGAENALMRSVIDSAVGEVVRSIRSTSSPSSLALLSAFEAASSNPAAVVVALDESVVLQSAAASAVLSAPDIAVLRTLTDGWPTHRCRKVPITLHNGIETAADVVPVPAGGGVVVTVRIDTRVPIPRSASPARLVHETNSIVEELLADGIGSAAILGEPGTGRTTTARALIAGRRLCTVDAVAATPDTVEDALRTELDRHCHDVLLVENADLLTARSLAIVNAALEHREIDIVVTGIDPGGTPSPYASMVSRFPGRIALRPLRDLRYEIFDIVRVIQGKGARLRFDGASARALTAYSWPGNLTELHAVLTGLDHRRSEIVTLTDLPAHIRRTTAAKPLTPWQRASCDVIELAMDLMHGNKAHAADFLGISRSTLYHHLKEYGLHT